MDELLAPPRFSRSRGPERVIELVSCRGGEIAVRCAEGSASTCDRKLRSCRRSSFFWSQAVLRFLLPLCPRHEQLDHHAWSVELRSNVAPRPRRYSRKVH